MIQMIKYTFSLPNKSIPNSPNTCGWTDQKVLKTVKKKKGKRFWKIAQTPIILLKMKNSNSLLPTTMNSLI